MSRNRNTDDNEGLGRDSRRELRRHRRVKSQIIAYITIIILILVIAAGSFLGIRVLSEKIEKLDHSQSASVSSVSAEAVTIAEPSDVGTSTQSEEEMLDEIVQACISEMPLEDKIAGLFMISPEQLTGVKKVIQAGDGTQTALAKYAVGGLVYSAQNIKDSEQLSTMISSTANMSKYPMFYAISETGGDNSPVADALSLEKAKGEKEIGDMADVGQASVAGQQIASYLSEYGFNFDIGPTANIAGADSSESDMYGSDQTIVSDNSSAMIQALQDNGITSCMRYYPVSSATVGASTDVSIDDIRNNDMAPFQAGISAGAKAIMVSSTVDSNVTADETPFCLSSVIINDILRNEMSYDGIVVTDALNSEAISGKYTPDQAAVSAISAGADIIYMPSDFIKAYDGLLAAVKDGTITEDRINESLTRIYRVKYEDKVDDITAGTAGSADTSAESAVSDSGNSDSTNDASAEKASSGASGDASSSAAS